MKTRLLFVALAISTIAVSAFGWGFYQHSFSSEFKRTMLAFEDSSSSETDSEFYLRKARLDAVTAKDKDFLAKLEHGLGLIKSASSIRKNTWDSAMSDARFHDLTPCARLFDGDAEERAKNRKDCDARVADAPRRAKEFTEERDLATKEEQEGIRICSEIRAELGLKPEEVFDATAKGRAEYEEKINAINAEADRKEQSIAGR